MPDEMTFRRGAVPCATHAGCTTYIAGPPATPFGLLDERILAVPGGARACTPRTVMKGSRSSSHCEDDLPPGNLGGLASWRRVGNPRSRLYYRRDCPSYSGVAAQNRVQFGSVAEAEKAGYRIRGNCPQ
jgi:hypothetical protein